MKFAVPLAVFALIALFLSLGLGRDPRAVPSPLVDRPAPAFRLIQLENPARTFAPDDLRGRVWMLNVWASWCVSCRAEHPLLTALARARVLPVYGLDYKDEPGEALRFLETFGNPYELTVQDHEGSVGIDYGVYGVPETYLIDARGFIRYKQIGPLTREILEQTLLPLAARLRT